jgi:predicted transposase YbfD/YdcC
MRGHPPVYHEIIILSPRDTHSDEIPEMKPLLDPLPLQGRLITADALHTQRETARWLVEEKGADYLFTVKDNQGGLKQDLEALDFFPRRWKP